MPNQTTSRAKRVPLDPSWISLLTGVALLGAAWSLTLLPEGGPILPRGVLLLVGFVLTYATVVRRLRRMRWDFPGRLEAAAMVSVSILGAVACFAAMEPAWTSGRVFCAGLFALTLVGAMLILLPPVPRRVALSLLVVFHLGGIVTAVTSVEPREGAAAPWVSQVLMARVYRPYLDLLYMSNAYRFYSPDPGTSSVLRFAVFYDDGEFRWHTVPDKKDCPIGMTYQRLNALPEQSFYPAGRFPPNEAELQANPDLPPPPHGSWQEISGRRQGGSSRLMGRGRDRKPIPMVLDLEPSFQYQQPSDVSALQIASLARHIWYYPPARREGATITSVKVYRVKVMVLSPYELARGKLPTDPTKLVPYFLGEFDKAGTLLHPNDPFLYWYLPMVRVPLDFPGPGDGVPYVNVRVDPPKRSELLNSLELHAETPSVAQQKERK